MSKKNGQPSNDNNMWLRHAVFESLLILIGIVLGFWVNEWREDLQKKTQGQAALARIVEELEDNRLSVQQILPYHKQVLQKLVALEENIPDAPMIETFLGTVASQGVGDLFVQDEAWKTASARDSLVAVDFSLVQQIASVYNLADTGPKSTWNNTIALFSEKEAFEPAAAPYMQKRFLFNYTNLVSQEQYLIQRYDAVLENINTLHGSTQK
ncbi:hypothetical protein [Kordiimonas aquimaris]|uniref:hypothetical protein n=1 Tax=Kordiimonas aquimaris TaxID=707591 RepID=UPI0021D18B73|nr:hypothetical protein [Kordiimonas aquimaris]